MYGQPSFLLHTPNCSSCGLCSCFHEGCHQIQTAHARCGAIQPNCIINLCLRTYYCMRIHNNVNLCITLMLFSHDVMFYIYSGNKTIDMKVMYMYLCSQNLCNQKFFTLPLINHMNFPFLIFRASSTMISIILTTVHTPTKMKKTK